MRCLQNLSTVKATPRNSIWISGPAELYCTCSCSSLLLVFFDILGLEIINRPLTVFLTKIFEFIPRLIGPILLIVAAWIVASILRFILIRVLGNSKFNIALEEKLGLDGQYHKSSKSSIKSHRIIGSYLSKIWKTLAWNCFRN